MIFHFHWWQMGSLAKSIPLWKTDLWRTVTEDVLQVPHASCPSVLLLLHQLMDHVQPVPVGLPQHLHDTSGCLTGSSGLGQLGQLGNITDTVSGAFLGFPFHVCQKDQSDSGSCSLGQEISYLSCVPQSLEMVVPGVARALGSVYVGCFCYPRLKHHPWLPQHCTPLLWVQESISFRTRLSLLIVWKSVASYGWLATKKFCTSYQHPAHVAFVSSSWTFLPLSFTLREKAWLVFQSLQTLLYQYEWVFKSHLWLKLPACIKQNWEKKKKKLMYFQCQSLQTQWSIQLFQATHDYGLLSCCPAT